MACSSCPVLGVALPRALLPSIGTPESIVGSALTVEVGESWVNLEALLPRGLNHWLWSWRAPSDGDPMLAACIGIAFCDTARGERRPACILLGQ